MPMTFGMMRQYHVYAAEIVRIWKLPHVTVPVGLHNVAIGRTNGSSTGEFISVWVV